MDVASLLKSKGSDVVSVRPDDTIASAVRLLKEKNFGALVVSANGTSVDGILSERDIVRHLDARGGALLEDSVSSIATATVTTCDPADSLDDLMSLMTEGRFRHVPVVEDGRLVGVISIGDVVKSTVAHLEDTNQQLNSYITGFQR
ncbi:MAG: CBS domain-containing protein [Acidimicrobiia bacterium]|nr:CBS domain-containing protein [Acidimicrobiia bacterium]